MPDTQITELYTQGNSCAEIARINECSETSVYMRLKARGVKMRSRSQANQLFPNSVFMSLYNIGLSASQIGRLLGVDSSTVIKRLHTIKFPLRSRDVAFKIRYSEEEFQRHFMVSDVIGQLMILVDQSR